MLADRADRPTLGRYTEWAPMGGPVGPMGLRQWAPAGGKLYNYSLGRRQSPLEVNNKKENPIWEHPVYMGAQQGGEMAPARMGHTFI